MKKKLFTLLLCAFAVVSANAWVVTFSDDGHTAFIEGSGNDGQNLNDLKDANGNDVSSRVLAADSLKFSGTINTLNPFQGGNFTNAKTVDFSKATFNETSKGSVSYTDINGNTQTVEKFQNCMRFEHFPNVTKAVLANVKTLNQDTFQNNSKITTFIIPNTVTCIESDMITNSPITKITIPASVKYIESQAFMNAAIKELIDVYVEGETAAAQNAFDFQVTVGQTDASYEKYATLHFPEGKEEFFTNTKHALTQQISLSKKAFQEWLDAHKNYSGANGWQQFINSASGTPEKVPEGKNVILRTFSDNVARLVPLNFRAYIVTGVREETVGDKKNYVLNLAQIFAIPANTGVILYGQVNENATGYSLGRIPSWDPGEEDYVEPYNRTSGEITGVDQEGSVSTTNYMVPTVTETILYPTYKSTSIWNAAWPLSGDMKQYTTGTEVTDRNFIMSKFGGTSLKEAKNVTDANNYVGFFRVKANVKCGPNKAYLSLPVGIYKSAEGAEALVVRPTDPASMIFRADEWHLAVSTGNWGQRGNDLGVLQAKFAGFEEEVTGISNVSTESVSDNGYYTLQGVKVAQPQKGVYVKNGKKVIIK